jgi:hypothetical protein
VSPQERGVVTVARPVYYSNRKRRHYLTLLAACRAEADARMRVWFPSEPGDDETGDPGWRYYEVPRLAAIRERLALRYRRTFRATEKATGTQP